MAVSNLARKPFRSLKKRSPQKQGRAPVTPPVSNLRPMRPELRRISIDAIDWTMAVRDLHGDHLERLAGAARLPPLNVWEFEPGRFRGVDGYHRWRIAKNRGDETVPAVIAHFPKGPAGEKQFDLESIRSNLQHGLPFTKAERDEVIRRFWRRWGHTERRQEGETLDDIGKIFSLTRQRIHQILAAAPEAEPRERGFSTLGRFTAATRRISTLLTDREFVEQLLQEQEAEVAGALRELHALIESVLSQKASNT